MQNLTIRKATLDDMVALQEMNNGLFAHDSSRDKFLNLNWPNEKEGLNYLKRVAKGRKTCCYLAEVEGKSAGYLTGAITEHKSWRFVKIETEIENIFVKKEFRNIGIGERLIKEFINWSKSKKAETSIVELYTSNLSALNFYKRNGFKDYGTTLEMEIK